MTQAQTKTQLTLTIEIAIGSEEMQTYFDLRHAIEAEFREMDWYPQAGEGATIRDINNHRVGRWSVEETPTFAERYADERTRAGNTPWHEEETDDELAAETELAALTQRSALTPECQRIGHDMHEGLCLRIGCDYKEY